MSYSSQFRGSPWQQGRQPLDVRGYSQLYGGYGDQLSMAAAYSRHNLERSAYGDGAYSSFRGMGYGSLPPAGYFASDRLSSYQDFYAPIRQKRPAPRSPSRDPRAKRLKAQNSLRQDRRRVRWRKRDSRRPGKSNKPENKSGESAKDISETNYDDYDSWKSSDDENETSVTQDKKEQSANDVKQESKVEADESDKKKDAKEPLACHVCKVTCSTLERFGNHMTSRTHRLKMEKLLVLQKEKTQVTEASSKASQQVESRDRSRKDKDRKKRKQYCTVCELSFSGNFLAHRRSKEHRKNRDKKYPKCIPCRASFNSSEEYKVHCKEELHKVKSAKFYYIRSLASGSDNDTAAIEPAKVQTPVVNQEEDKTAKSTDDVEKSEEKKEMTDSKPECKESAVTKENQPPGLMFVVATKGFYCKICRMFFKDATVAKVNHCRSIMHLEAYKKAMMEAMEQEEERQQLAEEQERQKLAEEQERQKLAEEQKAAEVAHTDGQVTPVEKVTEEGTEKETQKANDSGSGESADQSGNSSVVKMEVSSVTGEGKKEKTERTGEEIKEGTTTVEKVQVATAGSLFKQEPQVNGEEMKADKVKEECGPLPHPAPIKAAVEENVQPDSQEDKECEETKRESPGSRGTRRSRGRGRRR